MLASATARSPRRGCILIGRSTVTDPPPSHTYLSALLEAGEAMRGCHVTDIHRWGPDGKGKPPVHLGGGGAFSGGQ